MATKASVHEWLLIEISKEDIGRSYEEFYKDYIEPILPEQFKRVEWEILFYKNEVKIKIYD